MSSSTAVSAVTARIRSTCFTCAPAKSSMSIKWSWCSHPIMMSPTISIRSSTRISRPSLECNPRRLRRTGPCPSDQVVRARSPFLSVREKSDSHIRNYPRHTQFVSVFRNQVNVMKRKRMRKRKRTEDREVLWEAKNTIARTQKLMEESDKIFQWSRALHTPSKQERVATSKV